MKIIDVTKTKQVAGGARRSQADIEAAREERKRRTQEAREKAKERIAAAKEKYTTSNMLSSVLKNAWGYMWTP